MVQPCFDLCFEQCFLYHYLGPSAAQITYKEMIYVATHHVSRTVLARHVGVACLGQQVKASDRGEALLRALDDVIQLGVDEVGYGVARPLHQDILFSSNHTEAPLILHLQSTCYSSCGVQGVTQTIHCGSRAGHCSKQQEKLLKAW